MPCPSFSTTDERAPPPPAAAAQLATTEAPKACGGQRRERGPPGRTHNTTRQNNRTKANHFRHSHARSRTGKHRDCEWTHRLPRPCAAPSPRRALRQPVPSPSSRQRVGEVDRLLARAGDSVRRPRSRIAARLRARARNRNGRGDTTRAVHRGRGV